MKSYVIMGVAGCGKSSVGLAVAKQIGAVFIDGDDLHPTSNIEKMSRGEPLTDTDRTPWLQAIGETFSTQNTSTIIACSALKRKYRDLIRETAGNKITFLHLHGDRSVIEKRMSAREGHFMPLSLLDSQFRDLEELDVNEHFLIADIDQTFDEVVATFVNCTKGEIS